MTCLDVAVLFRAFEKDSAAKRVPLLWAVGEMVGGNMLGMDRLIGSYSAARSLSNESQGGAVSIWRQIMTTSSVGFEDK